MQNYQNETHRQKQVQLQYKIEKLDIGFNYVEYSIPQGDTEGRRIWQRDFL